jgi:hypothetical protein
LQAKAEVEELMIYTLESEVDEMLSFVSKKANKQWVWLAMAVSSRQIIAFHVGDRSRVSAQAQKEINTRMLPTACYVGVFCPTPRKGGIERLSGWNLPQG